MADFVDKQFAKEEVADKVLEQYDQEHTRIFYKYVMGAHCCSPSASNSTSSLDSLHRVMLKLLLVVFLHIRSLDVLTRF
jgi:hypothetical protein